ncbi:hypothetical protein H9Q71_000139 [Fusarium xylarioides]|nr:hypothetical protein H9Q71_000139 [Fusarium xylarioides]
MEFSQTNAAESPALANEGTVDTERRAPPTSQESNRPALEVPPGLTISLGLVPLSPLTARRRLVASSPHSTSFSSTETSHREAPRDRIPSRKQHVSAVFGSMPDEPIPPDKGALDHVTEDLKSQMTEVQNLWRRLIENCRKFEENESLIKTLQKENRDLKQRLVRCVTGSHIDSPQ